jgi:hypothetical protein
MLGHAWKKIFDATLDGSQAKHGQFRTQGLGMSDSVWFAQQEIPSTDQRLYSHNHNKKDI